ncbi:related to sugar transport protein STL1 [Cephalotrichum gorgonifer]|uniref:Related to sugar transport protein STL1 n=1 Tax=Cephalotrichum gorgonifer TaxID=2041049 RepID=A0AAE8N8B4_9PEZI|nr:related to sugar transport protein STL1 [Cephalotrichum gorgonifer]
MAAVNDEIAESNMGDVPTFWGQSGKRLQWLVTALATTDFLLFGYDQGVMSGIISADPFTTAFPEVVSQGPNYEGFVVSIYAVGCLFGALFILSFGDQVGRRRSIILGASIMIVGVIIQVATVPVGSGATAQFIIGRFITGLGNGINTSTVPTYQAECSRSYNRGKLICIEGSNVAFGTLIAYWVDYGCIYGPDDFSWRFPIAFQCCFAIVAIILCLGLPESPRWLFTKDRHDEGMRVLAALDGKPVDDVEVRTQAVMIVDNINASGHVGGVTPMSALFTNGKTQNFRRMMLGLSSQMMQQLSGCNAVIYYFPILFQNSIGVSHQTALLLGGVNMIVYSIFATSSWFLVERIGRRQLFLIGTVGQCLSMILCFGALIPDTEEAAKGAAVGLFTYIAFFGATWLPLPWLYPAEINSLKTRAKANACSTVSNWAWNFFIVMITPVLVDKIGWGTYLFFAVLNAIFFPIIYFLYPETAGRSLEEIDLIFSKGFEENISYVHAAQLLPKTTDAEIEARERIQREQTKGSFSHGSSPGESTPAEEFDTEK